ncbi:MAG: shikimate dehydrogenase [Notoacmeibacter sp.]|nr:shikimate dehydrogenase [Notoacmeibacter sp.]
MGCGADGASVRVGLVGRGIQGSRSPAMHEAAGAAAGLDYAYSLLDADMPEASGDLAAVLARAEAEGFSGLNITYPFKVDVMALLDDLSDNARMVGAVNTVVFRNGHRKGHNTDLWGFAENFRRNMAGAARGEVLLVGAGGAGAALAHALIECGTGKLWITDADHDKADALADRIRSLHGSGRASAVPAAADVAATIDGLVNATPVGMAKLPGMPVPATVLRPDMWVADIVYFPLETELLRTAREKGCRTLSGAGMAVFQAVRAFELFTGMAPGLERMEEAFASFDKPSPDGR